VADVTDDAGLWATQRAGQRSATGVVAKVSSRPSHLAVVLRAAAAADGAVAGRAALGVHYVRLEGGDLAERTVALREALHPRPVAVLDAPADVRAAAGAWPALEPGVQVLMRRVKDRFDPRHALRPGAFAGGI
jgi:glycolate oxidase FAD binding subunit